MRKFFENANSTINIFEKREKLKKILILQFTFLRRVNALKISQIKIELEKFEIRIQFRNRWVF